MHCLVTGVAGFIGSTLSERLLAAGHSVVGVDCFVDYYPRAVKEGNLKISRGHPNFRFIEADLATLSMPELLKDVEWIFHQAAQAGVRASWGQTFDSYCSNNIMATQRLLEACRGHATLKKLVYASSSSVYGDAETFPTPETIRPQPVSPYGVTKLAAENLMVLFAKEFGVPTVSLRYFTVYGPRQRPDMAFHKFIRAAVEGKTITLYGTGEQSRDFTFVDDIVTANILAAERGKPGEVFNIGGGTQATINAVLEIIGNQVREFGCAPLQIERQERQHGDASHTSADCSRAQKQLEYQPTVDLVMGIGREVQWMHDWLRR